MILAERDKEEMDSQLRRALRGSKVQWHTRSGAPHAVADLEKVAAGQARTVILLQPDSAQVRTELCLTATVPTPSPLPLDQTSGICACDHRAQNGRMRCAEWPACKQ